MQNTRCLLEHFFCLHTLGYIAKLCCCCCTFFIALYFYGAMLHKTQISCLQMNIDSKDFGLMRILNSVEFVIAFSSKWIFSNISIFIMILAIENLVWMEPKQVKQNKNGDKNDRNLHANMLLKFVSPVVVKSILTGNDETWYNYIATTHSTKSFLSLLSQINKCIYFVGARFTMHTLLRGSNWKNE